MIALLKDRATTLNELADSAHYFYRQPDVNAELWNQHLTKEVQPALQSFYEGLLAIPSPWQREALQALIKSTVAEHKIKMPQLAMPLRILVAGRTQTPAIDAVLVLLGNEAILRITKYFGSHAVVAGKLIVLQ